MESRTWQKGVGDLEAQLLENVKNLLEPVFPLFDYTVIHDSAWTDIVDHFVRVLKKPPAASATVHSACGSHNSRTPVLAG